MRTKTTSGGRWGRICWLAAAVVTSACNNGSSVPPPKRTAAPPPTVIDEPLLIGLRGPLEGRDPHLPRPRPHRAPRAPSPPADDAVNARSCARDGRADSRVIRSSYAPGMLDRRTHARADKLCNGQGGTNVTRANRWPSGLCTLRYRGGIQLEGGYVGGVRHGVWTRWKVWPGNKGLALEQRVYCNGTLRAIRRPVGKALEAVKRAAADAGPW